MAKLSNFEFLKEHDPVFFQLGCAAEQSFSADPNTTLIKLRQLGEAFAQDMAARCGLEFNGTTSQADLLFKLNREIRLDPNIRDLLHTLRVEGNRATHQFRTQHKEALTGLRLARTLAIWFHQALGKQGAVFKPGPFVAPADPMAGKQIPNSRLIKKAHARKKAKKKPLPNGQRTPIKPPIMSCLQV